MDVRGMGRSILTAVALLAALEWLSVLPVRIRVVLAVYGAVLAVLVVLRRRLWLRHRTAFLGAGALSLAPVFAAAFLGYDDRTVAVVRDLLPTLTGWATLLALLPLIDEGDSSGAGIGPAWRPSRKHAVVFLAASFLLLATSHWSAAGNYGLISDEALYLAQSRWMNWHQVTWPLDEELAPFFIMRKVDYLNGHLYGIYPPGWPALLALFRFAGLEWWSSVILGTTSVALVYLIGARLSDRRTGAVAALLLATSQVFLMHHAGYMSHAPAITATLAGTWCLLAGATGSPRRQLLLGCAAGALLGYVVTVRPLTGVTLGASVVLFSFLVAWESVRKIPVGMLAGLLTGAVIPAALFLAYNQNVLGNPLAVTYTVMSPGTYDLGFGQRGVRMLDANMKWVPATFDFGPLTALQQLLRRVAGLNTTFVPIGLLAPIMATAVAAGFRIPWARVAVFALLPAVHFFYWGEPLRLYAELLPFLLLGVAGLLVFIYDRWPRMALGLLSVYLASQILLGLPWPEGREDNHRPWSNTDYVIAEGRPATLQVADSLARLHPQILLFSREGSGYDNQIDRLYQFNRSLDAPILVARDRGPENAILMARFPNRVAFLVEDLGPDRVARFTRIAP